MSRNVDDGTKRVDVRPSSLQILELLSDDRVRRLVMAVHLRVRLVVDSDVGVAHRATPRNDRTARTVASNWRARFRGTDEERPLESSRLALLRRPRRRARLIARRNCSRRRRANRRVVVVLLVLLVLVVIAVIFVVFVVVDVISIVIVVAVVVIAEFVVDVVVGGVVAKFAL